MALDATPGGVASNSYATVAEANAMLMDRLDTAPWYDEGSDTTQPVLTLQQRRESGLIWATQLLDTLVPWRGTPTTTTQALWWPQTGQVDPLGQAIAPTVVPDVIKRATALYALALLRENTNGSSSTTTGQAIRRRRIGGMEIEYQQTSSTAVTPKSASTSVPSEVSALLRPYGAATSSVLVPLARG